ncbi:putative transcription factor MYB-related family [Helianthus annuus]|nr:putative transcription factor MYB-related family [Helianthus annuus]
MASPWTPRQNMQLEQALAAYNRDSPNRWQNIARAVEGKSVEEVKRHYDTLVTEIIQIERGSLLSFHLCLCNYEVFTYRRQVSTIMIKIKNV